MLVTSGEAVMPQDNEQPIGYDGATAPEAVPQPATRDFPGSYLELMFGTIDHAARARAAE